MASKEMELAIKIAGKIDSSFNAAMSTVTNTIGSAAKAVAAGTVAAAAAVGGLTLKAVDIGREFESSMSQVKATMLLDTATEEGAAQYAVLEEAARACGRETAFSATEAAQALNNLAMAGYDSAEAAGALPTVLNLAGAGNLELADAAGYLTAGLASLGLERAEENFKHFADILAITASEAQTDVAGMGEAITTLGGTGAGLKGGTEEIAACLGILADANITASEGGTHLRNMILALQNPKNADAAEMFENLGIQAYDAEGNMRGLNEVFGDLADSMDGMTREQRDDIMSTIFNKTDLAAASALLRNCGDRYDELYDAALHASEGAGAAAEMYARQRDNLEGDISTLQSALSDLGIGIYNKLSPHIREVVQELTGMVTEMSTAFEEGGLEGLAEAAGGCLADLVAMIAEYVPQVVDAALLLVEGLISGIIDNADRIATSGAAAAASFVLGVIRLVPMVLLAGIDLATSFARAITGEIPTIISSGAAALLSFALGVAQRLPTIIETGLALVRTLVSSIVQNAPTIIASGIVLIASLITGFGAMLPELVDQGLVLVSGLVDAVVDNLPLMIQAGRTMIGSLIRGVLQSARNIINRGPTIVRNLVSGVNENLPQMLEAGSSLIMELITGIGEILPAALAAGAEIILTVVGGVSQALPLILTAGSDLILWLLNGLINYLPTLVQSGVVIITNLINGLAANLPQMASKGMEIVMELVLGIIDMLPDLLDSGFEIITSVIQGVTENLPTIADTGMQIIFNVISGITGNLGNLISAGINIVLSLLAGLIGAIPSLVAGAASLIGNVVKAFFECDWLQVGVDIVGGIIDGFMESFGKLIETAKGLWKDFKSWLTGENEDAAYNAADILGYTQTMDGRYTNDNGETYWTAQQLADQGNPQAQAIVSAQQQSAVDNARAMEEAGAESAQAYASGMEQSRHEVSEATRSVMESAEPLDMASLAASARENASQYAESWNDYMSEYDYTSAAKAGIGSPEVMSIYEAAGAESGSMYQQAVDGELESYHYTTAAAASSASELNEAMGQAGSDGGQELIDRMQAKIAAETVSTADLSVDTSGIISSVETASQAGGETLKTWLTEALSGFTADTSGVGLDVSSLVSSLKSGGTDGGQALITGIESAISSGSGQVTAAATALGTSVDTAVNQGFQSAIVSASASINAIYHIVVGGANSAAAAVKSAFESMVITIPKPKIPEITVSEMSTKVGDQDVKTPKFTVNWNALGGIFDRAAIMNTTQGLQGAGEAGPEALLPLDTLWVQMREILSDILDNRSRENTNFVDSLLSRLDGIGGAPAGPGMQLAGAGGETINFSPVYNLYGTATREDAQQAAQTTFEEFKRFMKQYEREKMRLQF